MESTSSPHLSHDSGALKARRAGGRVWWVAFMKKANEERERKESDGKKTKEPSARFKPSMHSASANREPSLMWYQDEEAWSWCQSDAAQKSFRSKIEEETRRMETRIPISRGRVSDAEKHASNCFIAHNESRSSLSGWAGWMARGTAEYFHESSDAYKEERAEKEGEEGENRNG
ncbi:hypothetical protein SCHPADRAFT_897024 [Schizopora paradoxa]|uniref:Uncharacterized protein n=1 Tax=Schizopora paradoxa TaxID=27342 RepID=A0A0H2QYK8_9AGAM|nr:hypothetical protein SCHPADRAFT_897024 [Schizopora paradoxa]